MTSLVRLVLNIAREIVAGSITRLKEKVMRNIIGWRLAAIAVILVATFLTAPAAESQYCEGCCCSCDMRSVYTSCMDGCGWAPSCQNGCYNQWMAAENECIQSCPWPIC